MAACMDSEARNAYAAGLELLFDDIEPGAETPAYAVVMTAETIRAYAAAIGDDNPIHRDEAAAKAAGYPGLVAPPATVGIYARISNLLGAYNPKRKPPPGVIHAGQVFEFSGLMLAGDTIVSRGRVLEKAIRKERKFVTFETLHDNQHGQRVARGEISVIWPK